jgi:Adenylate kinase
MKIVVSLLVAMPILSVAFVTPSVRLEKSTMTSMDPLSGHWGVHPYRMATSLLAANIIIAGAPASGKGTQCEVIKEKFGVVHLSTGDMLRAAVSAGTEVGKMAKDFMDSGKLVPDEVIIGVVSCLNIEKCIGREVDGRLAPLFTLSSRNNITQFVMLSIVEFRSRIA